jgi:hypothetical protein
MLNRNPDHHLGFGHSASIRVAAGGTKLKKGAFVRKRLGESAKLAAS